MRYELERQNTGGDAGQCKRKNHDAYTDKKFYDGHGWFPDGGGVRVRNYVRAPDRVRNDSAAKLRIQAIRCFTQRRHRSRESEELPEGGTTF